MLIRINGDLLGDLGGFAHHFHPTHIVQDLYNAPGDTGHDFFIVAGIAVISAAIGHYYIPKDRVRLKSVYDLVTRVVVAGIALLVVWDGLHNMQSELKRW